MRMAEYGILAKIGEIKGNTTLDKLTDEIQTHSLSFGSGAAVTMVGSPVAKRHFSVTQSEITAIIHAGAWTAELLQALLHSTKFKEVKFTQIAQAVDATKEAKSDILQTLTLNNAVLTALNQEWTGDEGSARKCSLTFDFESMSMDIGGKLAGYINKNWTKGAK
jgi:hypothetical protein